MAHICARKLTTIDSDNGVSPARHQAIIWTNAGMLLIGPLEKKNFSEISMEIQDAFGNVVRKLAAILSQSQFVNVIENIQRW